MNSKKQKAIFDAIQPKQKKRKHFYEDDSDDIDDNEDSDELSDEIYNSNLKSRKSNRLDKSPLLNLPGGLAKSKNPYDYKCVGSGVGEANREIVYNIRKYMDILLNSAVLEAKYLTSSEMGQSNSLLAIPGIVSAILEYNNISFRTIKYCVTRIDLYEPVWYTYNITKNELILYINEGMYEEFCSKNNNDPVIFTSGLVPIEIFNPYENNPSVDILQPSIIHCAIASDHVAQHIIYDLYCPNKVPCADIHDKFCDVGTTLHSMFYLERTCTRMPKREYSNYLTLGGTSMPLLGATQRIIDSIIPPQPESSSNTFAYSI